MPAQAHGARRAPIILIAGFGDGGAMYAGLQGTALAERHRLHAIDLPGFAGTPRLPHTSLEALAAHVDAIARAEHADTVVAHSVASIIASLAARRAGSTIRRIVSLEGNLTAADAYFSGSAADYRDAASFRAAFLARLDALATSNPVLGRYRAMVARADPVALWELGCDAHRFSQAHVPGALLQTLEDVWYLYNPANCPPQTLAWLDRHPIKRIVMANASHWKSVDQPAELSAKVLEALAA